MKSHKHILSASGNLEGPLWPKGNRIDLPVHAPIFTGFIIEKSLTSLRCNTTTQSITALWLHLLHPTSSGYSVTSNRNVAIAANSTPKQPVPRGLLCVSRHLAGLAASIPNHCHCANFFPISASNQSSQKISKTQHRSTWINSHEQFQCRHRNSIKSPHHWIRTQVWVNCRLKHLAAWKQQLIYTSKIISRHPVSVPRNDQSRHSNQHPSPYHPVKVAKSQNKICFLGNNLCWPSSETWK